MNAQPGDVLWQTSRDMGSQSAGAKASEKELAGSHPVQRLLKWHEAFVMGSKTLAALSGNEAVKVAAAAEDRMTPSAAADAMLDKLNLMLSLGELRFLDYGKLIFALRNKVFMTKKPFQNLGEGSRQQRKLYVIVDSALKLGSWAGKASQTCASQLNMYLSGSYSKVEVYVQSGRCLPDYLDTLDKLMREIDRNMTAKDFPHDVLLIWCGNDLFDGKEAYSAVRETTWNAAQRFSKTLR